MHRPLLSRAKPSALASAFARLLVAVAAVALAGCAMLPARSQAREAVAAAASAPVREEDLAHAVDVVGARGRLTPVQRERVLKRLASEGKRDALNRHLAVMAAIDEVDLYHGNEADLLVDGPETFAAMFEAIERARASIFLESYIIEDSSVATRLAVLLARKSREGVPSYVIYDSVGSISASVEYFQRLEAAGTAVCAFNPVNPLQRLGYWDIINRDHRKILVVDDRVAFTGGINVSEVYSAGSGPGRGGSSRGGSGSSGGSGSGRDEESLREQGWRDTQIRIRGPAVRAFDELFRGTWQAQGCKAALPPPRQKVAWAVAGEKVVRVIASGPTGQGEGPRAEGSRIYTALLSAVDAAEQSIHFTMAYFAPGEDMIDALCEAAQRRVDVQLILPSVSDFSMILHAGRAHYERLLRCGVKLHELEGAVLHAKTAVIDGVLSTVGSSNLDWRSFVDNNEVNALVLGEDFARRMEAMFQRDRKESRTITLPAWRARPVGQRMKEWFASLFERWL